MLEIQKKNGYTCNDLEEIMAILRSENGCPWDREQTHSSIKRNFIEEVYEAVEAIETDDPALLCEELGDVLLQVVFHAQMAKEAARFSFDDVVSGICKKLILRHPHIFSDTKVSGTSEVLANWEDIKNASKDVHTVTESMERVAKPLPALIRAEKVQAKAQKAGFDFPSLQDALDKVEEETLELRSAPDREESLSEYGDLLFSVVNLSRFLDCDPEATLTSATNKFIDRFSKVEEAVLLSGRKLPDVPLAELEAYWQAAK